MHCGKAAGVGPLSEWPGRAPKRVGVLVAHGALSAVTVAC